MSPTSESPIEPVVGEAVPGATPTSVGSQDTLSLVPTKRARFKTAAYRVLSRCGYWSPVLVVLVLFAMVAFRGLRPAMAEARRLAAAEVMLEERHARASAENREVSAHLAARQDPIFRERLRRLRVIGSAPLATVETDTAQTVGEK